MCKENMSQKEDAQVETRAEKEKKNVSRAPMHTNPQ
jgi:hypothetical protein